MNRRSAWKGLWQGHIDRIDGRVVRDFIKVFVVVDRTCRNAVLGRNPLRLVAVAADEPSDLEGGLPERNALPHDGVIVCDQHSRHAPGFRSYAS